ncbi:hypothetical protein RJ640_014529 [Escallonia rubra]|uniref:Uncharacterized protein n=1 Tax=Escallonia rubra TaxID=112253 RepID=A0AA88UFN9_9ASTE|nr:hypothetical protein RJ640_014529 [Escallonia rubra]
MFEFSFVCDALDGWFARKFNQVSTFGAVLDMVTDRYCQPLVANVQIINAVRFIETLKRKSNHIA